MHKLNITLQPQMESSVMYLKITKQYFSKPRTAKTIHAATKFHAVKYKKKHFMLQAIIFIDLYFTLTCHTKSRSTDDNRGMLLLTWTKPKREFFITGFFVLRYGL